MYNMSISSKKSVSSILVAPPTAGAKVSIGGAAQLQPSPFVNATIEKNIVDDIIIGGILKVQLNGTIVQDHFPDVLNQVKAILDLAKNSDCTSLEIECGGARFGGYGKIISASVSEGNQPTWTRIAPYSIEMELYVDLNGNKFVNPEKSGTPESSTDPDISDLALTDLSEQFSISIDEDSFNWGIVDGSTMSEGAGVGRKHVKVSFNISAKGQTGGDDCVDVLLDPQPSSAPSYYGLAAVEQYMLRRFARLKNMDLSGLKNKPDVEIVPALENYRGASYLDFRTLEVNPINSSMTLSGDIIYRPSGCYEDVFTTVTVEESLDKDGNQITISGNVIGLVDSNYQTLIHNAIYLNAGACTTDIKMHKAETFFDSFKNEDNLLSIAKAHFTKSYIVDACGIDNDQDNPLSSCFPTESLNPSPDICELRLISSQVSKDYPEGQINFTFVFSNKQEACSIPGVSNLEIEATHDIPRDNIVEVIIPGRGSKGMLTQNLCVLSADRWGFTVNMTLKNKKCKIVPQKTIDELRNCSLSLLDKFITDANIVPNPKTSCWFITDNQEVLGRNTYRYTIQYTKPSCP